MHESVAMHLDLRLASLGKLIEHACGKRLSHPRRADQQKHPLGAFGVGNIGLKLAIQFGEPLAGIRLADDQRIEAIFKLPNQLRCFYVEWTHVSPAPLAETC